jgi:predicted transcriptional regulator
MVGKTKLTEVKVKKIKRDLQKGVPQSRIAENAGVSQVMVCHIKKGRAWAHVSAEG